MILVSHDPHLVELVADRLWLVKDGRVAAVRRRHGRLPAAAALRAERRRRCAARPREEKPKPRPAPRAEVAPLRAEVAKCEARVAKLEAMRDEIDWRLANPLLYSRGDTEAVERLQRKRAEVEDGLARAEALWLAALERLEAAGAGMTEVLVPAFVTLFVIIDPIGLAPLFIALTRGMTAEERDAGRAAGARRRLRDPRWSSGSSASGC